MTKCGDYHSCQNDNLDLHHEIEELQTKLRETTALARKFEDELVENRHQMEQERLKHQDELRKSKDRYERLVSSHQRLSKLNHELEEKLLNTVECIEQDKTAMAQEINSLTERLLETEATAMELWAERNRLKEDCTVAAGLLQANPEQFLGSRLRRELKPSTSASTGNGFSESTSSSIFTLPAYLPTFPPIAVHCEQAPSKPKPTATTNDRNASTGEPSPTAWNTPSTVVVDL